VPAERLAEGLVSEGVAPDLAAEVAAASGGRPDRARLLASDPGFVARRSAWSDIPHRLDGTGATTAALADELLGGLETVLEPLRVRHSAELAELGERVRLYGDRPGERKELETRHKREERRLRTDELRFGLATLAGTYRDQLASARDAKAAVAAVDAVAATNEALAHNPNVVLLLQALLVRVGRLGRLGPGGPPLR
jgi:DNA polymerase-3 subunit delta'